MGIKMQEINKYSIQAKRQNEERERMEFSRSKSRLQFAIKTGARRGLLIGLCAVVGVCLVQSIEWSWPPGFSSEYFTRPSGIATIGAVVLGTVVAMVVQQWFRWSKLNK